MDSSSCYLEELKIDLLYLQCQEAFMTVIWGSRKESGAECETEAIENLMIQLNASCSWDLLISWYTSEEI